MSDDAAPQLRGLLERFDSSRETLDQLTERLRSLALAEETSSQAADSIASAAEQLEASAKQLEALTDAATAAQTELKGAVEAAGDFLERTELSDLSDALESVNEATSKTLPEAIRTANEQTVERINERLSALERRLADLEQTRQSEADLRAQLDQVRTRLSARKLAQLGLQPPAAAQQPPPSDSQDASGS